MSLDPRSQAVGNLNTIASLAQQALALQAAVNALTSAVSNQNAGNGSTGIWQQFPTCAQNADGSLGTPDGSPNQVHPMNAPLVPGLTRAATYAQYTGALNAIATTINANIQALQAMQGS